VIHPWVSSVVGSFCPWIGGDNRAFARPAGRITRLSMSSPAVCSGNPSTPWRKKAMSGRRNVGRRNPGRKAGKRQCLGADERRRGVWGYVYLAG